MATFSFISSWLFVAELVPELEPHAVTLSKSSVRNSMSREFLSSFCDLGCMTFLPNLIERNRKLSIH
ncbi:hypothetical protein KTAU_10130 [Thermogemmatispora aurantia]|uniref:Uncharacterized protein n=1 Tax=Thermogemmatispora aurantia TaxID=2045279 RepID=A0A5J4K480_9CHLR|nr:hypothetical protein KTAU_10130 [Thermogemmatispora aurantia]